MNEHFINITKSLKINNIPHEVSEEIITINDIIKGYRNHPSIKWIKSTFPTMRR